jgi:glycogen debranching enzyme
MPEHPTAHPTPAHPPRQPWLHELTICVDGNLTALSGAQGDLEPGTAQGLYADDARVLSGLRVTVDGERPSAVAARARGAHARFLGSARNVGVSGPDPTVEVRRARTLRAGGMDEVVTVASRHGDPVLATVELELAADGAEISAVKAGRLDEPAAGVADWDGHHLTFALPRHHLEVTLTPTPTRVALRGERAAARFDVEVAPGSESEVRLDIAVSRRAPSLFDADPGSTAPSPDAPMWNDVRVVADDPRLGPLVDRSLDDLRHLLLRDPLAPEDVFAAAGTPWYLTLFGRDALWAARLTLPFGTDLAAGTLRTLARRQGRERNDVGAEAPGKILHEVRRTAYVVPGSGLALPPLYYGTVDATALWVVLLVEAWRWGLPEPQVRELLPALDSALEWLTGDGQPDGDGLLKYLDVTGTGLANQGWKDSEDSMRMRDGRLAAAPITLVEAQAYAVQALDGGADLLDHLGLPGSQRWREAAQRLRATVRERFWVDTDAGHHLALALDGDGSPVDGLGSNMGHVLGTGALTASEAAQVAATLTGPELLDDFGIRTLGSGNGGFNPIGYHTGSIWTHDTAVAALGLQREGFDDEAARVARALVAAGASFDNRWPELYTGLPMLGRPAPYPASCVPQAWSAASAGAVVAVALGLRADAPNRVLEVRPPHAMPFGGVRVEGLRFAGEPFTVEVNREGGVSVLGVLDEVQVRVSA